MNNPIAVRRIQIGETNLYKQIRLASLQDAPYAFETTYDSAVRRKDEFWRERAESGSQGGDVATFFAFSKEFPIGIATLLRINGQTDTGELMQVWVNPDYRGTNVIWDLIDAIFKWAKENNFRRIIAGVKNENTRALTFYTKYGFSIMDRSTQTHSGGVYLVKVVH
jgi:RimJ/RimL family protein N-acetyltransferase